MDAAAHARRASELLVGVERRLSLVNDLTDEQHLQMIATGGFKQHNSEVETSLTLARNHALTSLAMQGIDPSLLEPTGDHPSDAGAVSELAGGGAE